MYVESSSAETTFYCFHLHIHRYINRYLKKASQVLFTENKKPIHSSFQPSIILYLGVDRDLPAGNYKIKVAEEEWSRNRYIDIQYIENNAQMLPNFPHNVVPGENGKTLVTLIKTTRTCQ
jgi:hypothetical protein